jgi:hypothetical protein
MHIRDLLNTSEFMEENIQEGDVFELELDDFVLETVVIGLKSDGPILAIDETGLAYIETEELHEAEYHGHKVPLGKPMRGDVKKSKVYVKNPKTGKVVKVNFGDKKLSIKKHLPKHRRSFRARHHCENPGPRTKARYWSCRAW